MFADLGRFAKLVSPGDDVPHLGADVIGGVVVTNEGCPFDVGAGPNPKKSCPTSLGKVVVFEWFMG